MDKVVDDSRLILFTRSATAGERRVVVGFLVISATIFVALVPFAQKLLGEFPAFIGVYEATFALSDVITAVLLFGQYRLLPSAAILALATGYLFTAFMAVAHAFTFPGLFAPNGLLGAGPNSTAWMYMFWHGAFPLSVIAYGFFKADESVRTNIDARMMGFIVAVAALAALYIAGALTLLATAGKDMLPSLMHGNQFAPAQRIAIGTVWLSCLLALAVLWWRKPHSILDTWLMVVMSAWFFDIGLSGIFNAARFDLGFYFGRVYGLVAAGFVLIALFLETKIQNRGLAVAHESEHREERPL